MTTLIQERPFSVAVDEARHRVEVMNPIDRTSVLERLAFFKADNGQAWTLKPVVADGKGQMLMPDTINLSDHAVRQLMEMVGYSTKLLETLPKENVFRDVNYLMQTHVKEKTGFIRMVNGNEARAILSGRFTPLDDLELLEICADYLQDAVIRYHGVGEMSSHLTVTFPNDVTDDGVEPGIHIANSEVGSRAITIQSVLFRRICTNVLPRIFQGDKDATFGQGKNGNLYERLTDGAHDLTGARSGVVQTGWRFTHRGDANALRAFVADSIADAKNSYDPMLQQWKEGLRKAIENPAKAIEALGKKNKLTKEELLSVLNAHTEEAAVSGTDFSNSLTGVVNGFTRAANGAPIEQRYKLQVAGASGFVYLQ